MPLFTLRIRADHNGLASEIEVVAPTAWVAIERNLGKIGAFGAEVMSGGKSLGVVTPGGAGRRAFFTLCPAAE